MSGQYRISFHPWSDDLTEQVAKYAADMYFKKADTTMLKAAWASQIKLVPIENRKTISGLTSMVYKSSIFRTAFFGSDNFSKQMTKKTSTKKLKKIRPIVSDTKRWNDDEQARVAKVAATLYLDGQATNMLLAVKLAQDMLPANKHKTDGAINVMIHKASKPSAFRVKMFSHLI